MESIWSKTCEISKRNTLEKDLKADTVIIGAGLAGILTAYRLKEKGIQPVILETGRIASGQSKNTTAKITSQHGAVYSRLIKQFGKEKARQYADANNCAIDEYASLISSLNIDCDFEIKDSYVYSMTDKELLKEEAKAAKELGLPAEYTETVSIPLHIAGAVKFKNQAQFNPLKFINKISEDLCIYENSPVKTIDGGTITLQSGRKVQAKNIVVASHFPFINSPGFYFARMHQSRSYAIAFENAPQINGMYVDTEEGGLSFRNYKEYLIIVGADHRTGENKDGGKYDTILKSAQYLFPDAKEFTRWSAQDCITTDGVPYIGRYSEKTPYMYVATGFMKWGMTTSMTAADIISDMITGKENKNAEVFSPQRFSSNDIKQTFTDGIEAVKGLIKEPFSVPSGRLDEIQEGHGAILESKKGKIGVYKDYGGKLYAVKNKCPHLGCQLEWNADEKTWDCPCHGSRFDYTGRLIDNPAQSNLRKEEIHVEQAD